MHHTRTGKIARLPKVVREVLGDRLEQGDPAIDLVHWLNGLQCVQQSLAEHFGGRPITEQNLSEWRAGGHQDWLRHEETRRLVDRLAEQGDDLAEAAHGQELTDRFARRLAVQFMRLAETLLDQATDPAQGWTRLCEINRELSRLRRDDQQTTRLRLHERRLVLAEDESPEDIWNRRGHEEQTRRISPLQSRLLLNDLESDAQSSPRKQWWEKFRAQDAAIAAAGKASPDPNANPKSGPIQPNPTKSDPGTKKNSPCPPPPAPGARVGDPQPVDSPVAPAVCNDN